MSTTTDMVSTEGELPGMPPPWELRLDTVGENAVVSCGRRALACYDIGDRGARRIAIVSLTRAGFSCNEVARVFGVHAAHVSRLRGKANEGGVAALLTEPGRRRKLDARGTARVYEMHDQGVAGGEIAKQLGVSGSVISRLLTARPAREADRLPFADRSDGADRSDAADADAGAVTPVAGVSESNAASGVIAAAGGSDLVDGSTGVVGGEALAARVVEGGGRSVYAGAMLLAPFLEKVGAREVRSALACAAARCYDSAAVALSSMFAFALGSSSLEGSKHLQPADAGLLVGIRRFPHLRTLRPRLAALADAVDPLALQVTFAKAMLAADSEPPSVFFVDGHFVAYTGSRPVSKGYNTRR